MDIKELIDSEFPINKRLTYLNHAAVAPWPDSTAQAVSRFAEECVLSGAENYPNWMVVENELKTLSTRLIGAGTPDNIALLKNTSEALSFVACGFPWQPGDKVIISDEEFPSNRIVWESLAPLGVTVVAVNLSREKDPESALLKAIDSQTKLLSISAVQYISGLRLDLERIGNECRKRNVAFCVDAIQALGALPVNVENMHIDFLMADGHKWLLGPEGLAIFYCRPEWRDRLALHEFGWHMVEHLFDFDAPNWRPADSARRFECGSPNMLCAHALHASLSLILDVGIETIENGIYERIDYLMNELGSMKGIRLLSRTESGYRSGIVTFVHNNSDSESLHRRLNENGVICAQRGGGIRFSPHFYVDMNRLEDAIRLLDCS